MPVSSIEAISLAAHNAKLQNPFHVLIIEDDPIIQHRFAEAMIRGGGCTVVSVGTLEDARNTLLVNPPDLILSDLCLPDGHAINFLVEVRTRVPKAEILVVSVLGDEKTILQAISSGAAGYILKDTLPNDIYALAVDVLSGGSPMSPSIARLVVMHARAQHKIPTQDRALKLSSPLTNRETEVLISIAKGYSYIQIAADLGISPNTVPSHIKAIYRKLRVENRSSAVYAALSQGIITL
jgi:DNA-binding NarL/FixJ family response regulator